MRAVVLLVLVACAGSMNHAALYRAGRTHELRQKLATRAPGDARAAILYARNEIDLRVVWDDGSFEAAGAALARAQPGNDAKLAAELVQAQGEVMFWTKLVEGKGAWPAIAAQFDRAIAMRQTARDRRGVAESMFYRGVTSQFFEPITTAKQYWTTARDLGKDIPDPLLRSYPIRHLGDAAEAEGDLVLAGKLHRESLALREQDGDVIRLFNARLTLATFLCERMRDCEAARPQIEAARRVADALKMPHGNVDVALLEAALAEWRGDLAAREAAWTKALATANADEAQTVKLLRGAARLRAGDVAGALADAEELASRDGHALRAEAAIRAGDLATAERALVAAWKDPPEKPSARMLLAAAAWLAQDRSFPGKEDPAAVRAEALAAAQRDHDVRVEIDVLVARGEHAAAKRRAAESHLPR